MLSDRCISREYVSAHAFMYAMRSRTNGLCHPSPDKSISRASGVLPSKYLLIPNCTWAYPSLIVTEKLPSWFVSVRCRQGEGDGEMPPFFYLTCKKA